MIRRGAEVLAGRSEADGSVRSQIVKAIERQPGIDSRGCHSLVMVVPSGALEGADRLENASVKGSICFVLTCIGITTFSREQNNSSWCSVPDLLSLPDQKGRGGRLS